MKTFLTALTLVLCLCGMVSSQCHRYDVNGCSIPYNLPYFYKQSFTPSCDKHDVCYECGAVKGYSKTACDIKLYNDVKAVCARNSLGKRAAEFKRSIASEFCKLISKSYYEAVKHFGASYYSRTSASWCSESWVRGCLP